jgi:hypothetical protein
MYEEFKFFMKTNGYWGKFVGYAGLDYMNEVKYHPKTFSEMIDVIADAFVFNDSEEGFDYWQGVHNDWINYCRYWKDSLA